MTESTPGPKPRPEERLRAAAVEFSMAVEAEGPFRREWDRLRKAAVYYAQAQKRAGRPEGT